MEKEEEGEKKGMDRFPSFDEECVERAINWCRRIDEKWNKVRAERGLPTQRPSPCNFYRTMPIKEFSRTMDQVKVKQFGAEMAEVSLGLARIQNAFDEIVVSLPCQNGFNFWVKNKRFCKE